MEGALCCQAEPVQALLVEAPDQSKDNAREESLGPRSECSTASFFSQGSSTPSEVSESDSDEEGDHVRLVEQYLESMNHASEKVNEIQSAMQDLEKDKAAFEELWTLNRARLIRALAPERFARVKAVNDLRVACHKAKSAVELASTHFLEATQSGMKAADVKHWSQKHAECLTQYMALQATLVQEEKGCPEIGSSAVVQYFESEQEHVEHMAVMDASMEKLRRRLRIGKREYQNAMKGLEMLSQRIHSRRGSCTSN